MQITPATDPCDPHIPSTGEWTDPSVDELTCVADPFDDFDEDDFDDDFDDDFEEEFDDDDLGSESADDEMDDEDFEDG